MGRTANPFPRPMQPIVTAVEQPVTRLAPPRPTATRPAIVSVATEVPEGRLTSAELAERYGLTEDWIISRTGVRERPIARADERLSDYAVRVGLRALERAGMEPAEIDLVIAATLTQDELAPNTAPLVAHGIGAQRAGAIDVGAACTAFLSGLAVAAAQIESGRVERVLLIGADFISRLNNWDDSKSAPLFADGVGAVVLAPVAEGHGAIGPIVLGADASHAKAILIEHSDRTIQMDGPEVYRNAITRMGQATSAALARAGLTLDDIDLFVYHQANARITRALTERLDVAPERVVDCIETLGNSSAATLPLGLAWAERDGRLKPGTRVLLGAFGAGFTWGAGVIEWGGTASV